MAKLKIEMLGANFTIQANEDEEYLSKLLGYYKRITDDVRQKNGIRDPQQVAILSGIMLCDELYKEKQNKLISNPEQTSSSINISKEDTDKLLKHTQQMIDKIDQVLN